MRRAHNKLVGRGLFGLAVLGALAFGATEAASSPTRTAEAASCTYIGCRNLCKAIGRPSGYCESGICLCD